MSPDVFGESILTKLFTALQKSDCLLGTLSVLNTSINPCKQRRCRKKDLVLYTEAPLSQSKRAAIYTIYKDYWHCK